MSDTKYTLGVVEKSITFEELVRSVMTDGKVTIGNVDFWVDPDGPWAGTLSYSVPAYKWTGVKEDLAKELIRSSQ